MSLHDLMRCGCGHARHAHGSDKDGESGRCQRCPCACFRASAEALEDDDLAGLRGRSHCLDSLARSLLATIDRRDANIERLRAMLEARDEEDRP